MLLYLPCVSSTPTTATAPITYLPPLRRRLESRARARARSCSCSCSRHSGSEDDADSPLHLNRKSHSLLVERYQDGTAKRYIVDDNSKLQTYWDEHGPLTNAKHEEHFPGISWIPSIVKNFLLPVGFPGSVSDDYLDYMLLQFPTNLTGWVCYTLVTSSLLKAVGVGSFAGTSAAASAAAIRWVSKDGLGAIGRLIIGGRFGNLFDDDPKQWRMYADIIGSAGSIFELSTQLYPAYFLPLASFGNLAKAIGRGLKDPSCRVIQNHFAVSANLGEVAAKEEVWEVAAQLLGLTLGVLVMDTPGVQTSYSVLALTWLVTRLLHLCLRYQSLSVLKFHTINLKRARVLVKSHVLYHTVPGHADCNKKENILVWERFLQPQVIFGVSMERMIGRDSSSLTAKALLKLYEKEKYVLYVNQCGSRGLEFFVTFKVGATGLSVLKSLWQAHWLHEHRERGLAHVFSWVEDSLLKLEEEFAEFLILLEGAGWDKRQINLKVPRGVLLDEAESLELASDK